MTRDRGPEDNVDQKGLLKEQSTAWQRLLLAGTLLALHVFYAVGDRTWWGEFVAVWPPIGWVAVFGIAIARYRDLVSLTLLLVLLAVHGEWPRIGGQDASRGALRVVTWNVSGRPDAWAHLKSLDPDLVLVQEHGGAPASGWDGFSWRAGFDAGTLSRYPIEVLPTRRVGPWTEPLLLIATLPRGGRLLLVNVRLVLPSVVTWVADGLSGGPRAGHEARVAQFPALMQLIDESRRRSGVRSVLLCGDFNSPATLPSLAPLRTLLVDAWSAAGRGWPGTATAGLPLARIDHCWATSDLEPISARARRMPVSDHRLLLVDYAWPEAR